MHLNGKGYKARLEGENKDDATSGDATVAVADREHESAATSSEKKHISNKRVNASLFFSSDRAGQNLEKKVRRGRL